MGAGRATASASAACSGRTTSAISSRSLCASTGDAPPVETATVIGSSRCRAGRMNEQSSGTSTTLQSSVRASASAKTRRLTAVVRSGGDDEEAAVEVGAPVPAVQQLDVERRHLDRDLRRDDGHHRAAIEQAAHLLVRHTACPDDEHASAFEVDARDVVMLLAQLRPRSRRAGRRSGRAGPPPRRRRRRGRSGTSPVR